MIVAHWYNCALHSMAHDNCQPLPFLLAIGYNHSNHLFMCRRGILAREGAEYGTQGPSGLGMLAGYKVLR